MSMCQGALRLPGRVAVLAGFTLATPDDNLANDIDNTREPRAEAYIKVGPQSFRQWAVYSTTTDGTLDVTHLYYNPKVPFLDWEMGLGTPFGGTYAPPIGLVAGGSA